MKQVGYGIIGAGNIAALHAKALSALKNAELVAVYDRNTAAAKRLAEEYGCEFCPDFRTFLADSRIQAVTIATPSGMHGAAAIPSADSRSTAAKSSTPVGARWPDTERSRQSFPRIYRII